MDASKGPAEDPSEEKERKTLGPWMKIRFTIAALFFLSTLLSYAGRVILSITIVAMLNNSDNEEFKEFDWYKEGHEELVLASFFWGYSLAQIPCGLFVQRFGAKTPLFGGMCASSLCVTVFPVAAMYGDWIAACVVRIVQGITQAFLFSCLFASMVFWFPLEERGRLTNIVLTGCQFGILIAFPIAGFLVPSDGGWPSVFYFFGVVGIFWSFLWYFLGTSAPSTHHFIRKDERELIESSINNKFQTRLNVPWREIIRCPSVWALTVANCAQNYGYWSLMVEIPTYLDAVFEFKIVDNEVLSALPFLTMAVLGVTFGTVSDVLFKKKLISVAVSRKIFNTLGFWVPAAALMALGFIHSNQKTLAIVLLVIAVGVNAGSFSGFILGHMDIAPNFSGVLMAFSNCLANIFSILGTMLAEFFVKGDKADMKSWRIVFSLASALLFVSNIFFVIVFKADRQPWNEPDYTPQYPLDAAMF